MIEDESVDNDSSCSTDPEDLSEEEIKRYAYDVLQKSFDILDRKKS